MFKALALGTTAVGIGRPTFWGLGLLGEAGVTRVLEILHAELKLVMGNCGVLNVREFNKNYVQAPPHWKV